ncbi:hypothetical protein HYPSUDRAFT_218706 [Hypholoma sublateritium FD-334 SS-4]|uniref:Fungal-type protein kinase domain-containing protein n=1 Tax=Hypholoma sublateritium (strain FD-334 SS-4) TaxID=945553 RepID=A0A0D2NM57_HYPSF|nr:hypothetical protein HYPSUDRAFT_218706 [Hypholoma sublateritium FD-334 SS-4]
MREILTNEGRTDKALDLDERGPHVLDTNRLQKLWDAASVDEFKQIFLDCLESHYHAWNSGKVLHRDISENNLMFYRPGVAESDQLDTSDTNPDRKGKEKVESTPPRGVLIDFDMSSELGPDGNIRLNTKPHHHITGTLPFMARDLLSQACNSGVQYEANVPGAANYHFYRYDLESFYYVLIWAAVTYKLPRRARKTHGAKKKNPLGNWLSPDPETVYVSKVLLYTGPLFASLDGSVSKGWKGLWNEWVKPLQLMFGEGLSAADAALRHGDANFDMATCNGLITFERFMDTIKQTPRGLNPAHV